MHFYVDRVEAGSPFAGCGGDGSFGDAIESEATVVDEVGKILAACGFFAPAVEVLPFFVVIDLGMADGELPDAFLGVLVGEAEGLVAADIGFDGESPGGRGVLAEVSEFLAERLGEFAAFE